MRAIRSSASAGPQDDKRIEELIKKLGSGNYNEREKARAELETIGLPALDLLREAAKTGDLETKTRCDKLIKRLEDKQAADVLLAPRKVKLDLTNVSVTQAIEELQKQSGYTIHVEGDRVPLNNRKITLQTGASKIVMKKDGTIQISGVNIEIKGSAKIKAEGAMINIEASGINTIKGSLVKIN